MHPTLDSLTPRARTTDPETSHQAAESVSRLTETHSAIYTLVKHHGPVSDEQIKALLDRSGITVSDSGARTRRSELVKAGFLTDSQRRGTSRSGRTTILWQAK